MPILKSEIRNKFTTIPNSVIQAKDISDGDFRLLIYLYSLPDGWKINQSYLGSQFGCNRRNINAKIGRIKEAGYLEIIREQKEKDVDYIYLLKSKECESVNDVSVNNVSSSDASVNDSYINTNIINTKKINNKENIKGQYFENKELNDLFLDFLEMRKKLKAVNSERAINNLLTELNKYSDEIKKQMINNAITNSWKSVYPIKDEKSEQTRKQPIFYDAHTPKNPHWL